MAKTLALIYQITGNQVFYTKRCLKRVLIVSYVIREIFYSDVNLFRLPIQFPDLTFLRTQVSTDLAIEDLAVLLQTPRHCLNIMVIFKQKNAT